MFFQHTHKKNVHNLSFKQHDQDSPEVALLQSDSENHRLWSFKIDFLVAEKDPRNSHPVGITTMTISTVQIFCWNSQIPSDGIGIYIYMYTDPVVYKYYSRRWQKKSWKSSIKIVCRSSRPRFELSTENQLAHICEHLSWQSNESMQRHPWEWFKVRDFRKTNCHVNWWDLSCQPKQSGNFTLLLLALKRCCWWKKCCIPGMYKTL